jgi:Holliday junction resolvasome RuvABC endonuclease subunit
MLILGIDPGSVSAAYAVVGDDHRLHAVGDVPVADRMVDAAAFAAILRQWHPDEAIIEQVSAMPRQGVSSSFRFGLGTGMLRGVILGQRIPLHQVTPSKWKKHFRLDSDAEKSRALAIRLWPDCGELRHKKDHGRAEAMLIARYHAETRNGHAA